MKKKRSIILSLGSVILFVLTGCTKTDTVNEDDILTTEPTAIITSEPTATLTSEPTATSTSEPSVVDSSAKKLLKEIETSPLTCYNLYNYPSHYYDFLSLKVDEFTEFLDCKDYATVTLLSYENADFYINDGQQDKSDEEWEPYRHKAIKRDEAIGCDEILLANENTFDTLSDKEKISVLNEVKENKVYVQVVNILHHTTLRFSFMFRNRIQPAKVNGMIILWILAKNIPN